MSISHCYNNSAHHRNPQISVWTSQEPLHQESSSERSLLGTLPAPSYVLLGILYTIKPTTRCPLWFGSLLSNYTTSSERPQVLDYCEFRGVSSFTRSNSVYSSIVVLTTDLYYTYHLVCCLSSQFLLYSPHVISKLAISYLLL